MFYILFTSILLLQHLLHVELIYIEFIECLKCTLFFIYFRLLQHLCFFAVFFSCASTLVFLTNHVKFKNCTLFF